MILIKIGIISLLKNWLLMYSLLRYPFFIFFVLITSK